MSRVTFQTILTCRPCENAGVWIITEKLTRDTWKLTVDGLA